MASLLSSLLPPFLKKPSSAEDETSKKEAENKAILKQFSQGLVTTQDIIAPEAIEVDFTFQKINSTYTRTLFVAGYPRTVPSNWLSPLINYPHQLDISMYVFPVDVREVLENLKRKITEMEAEITSDIRQGKISRCSRTHGFAACLPQWAAKWSVAVATRYCSRTLPSAPTWHKLQAPPMQASRKGSAWRCSPLLSVHPRRYRMNGMVSCE
jgi:hypothetical protein